MLYLTIEGNITSINWYNKVKGTNIKAYGKMMGASYIIIGIAMIITKLLQVIFESDKVLYITIIVIVAGLFLMLYAQIKYNKDIF